MVIFPLRRKKVRPVPQPRPKPELEELERLLERKG